MNYVPYCVGLLSLMLSMSAAEPCWQETFENGLSGWQLPPEAQISSEAACSGTHSLRLSGTGPLETFVNLPLESGRRYWVSMRVKVADWVPAGRNFSFAVEWNDAVQGFSDDGDWRTLRYLTGAMPRDDSQLGLQNFMGLKLYFDQGASGTVWVDDITLTPLEEEPLALQVEPEIVVGSDDTGPVRVSVTEAPAGMAGEAWTVKARLTSPPWQRILQEQVLTAAEPAASFDTASLPAGKYNILYTFCSPDGREQAQYFSHSIWKKEPLECRPIPHSGIVAERDLPLNVQLRANRAGRAAASLFDAAGKLVARTTADPAAGDSLTLPLAETLTPGQYRLEATLDDRFLSEQVINVLADETLPDCMYLAPDGFFHRRGKRYFPLIVYVHTCGETIAWEGEFDHRNWPLAERVLDDLEGTPFGLLDYGTPTGGLDDTLRFLQECSRRNIPVVFALKDLYERQGFFRLKQKAYGDASPQRIVETVLAAVKDDPNVLAYYINDELSSEFFNELRSMRELCHRLDPGKPVLQVHFEHDCVDELAQSYDIWGTEQYPWAYQTITAVSNWAKDTIAQLPPTAQYWGCLKIQVDHRASERDRALAYSSIADGARGLLFYSWFDVQGLDPNPRERWREFIEIGRELERDRPIFLLDASGRPVTSDTPELALRTFENEAGRFLLLVNTADRDNEVQLTVPACRTLTDRAGSTLAVPDGGNLSLLLKPLEVKIFSLDGAPFPTP